MYPNGIENGYESSISYYERLCSKARESSKKGDHISAIGFYKDAMGNDSDCGILSAIADEYEAIGEYAQAEDYWNRCCAVKRNDSYRYIAGKGDFFHRRERFEKAIDAYEDALKAMDGTNINRSTLKYYAGAVHFIIDSYGKLGEKKPEEKYHRRLKGAVGRYISLQMDDDKTKARYISDTVCEIYEDGRMCDEALILIDFAIKLHPDAEYYRRKAIFIKFKLEINVIVKRVKYRDLNMINEALKILPGDVDNGPYLKVKGDILKKLGESVKAKVCYALAAKDYDKVDEADSLLKKLTPYSTYINITGVQYYKHFAPFKPGTVVDLIKEPDNKHNPFAIRVEINGETVGYVANSRYTLIKEVKSAAEIKNTKSRHAKVQFILFDEWVIAKLI